MGSEDRPYGSLFDDETGWFLAAAEPVHLAAACLSPNFTFVLDQDNYEPVAVAESWQPSYRVVRVRLYSEEALATVVNVVSGAITDAAGRRQPNLDADAKSSKPTSVEAAWWTAAIAAAIAAFFFLSTGTTSAANGYTYRCPSAANMALNPDFIDIYPTGGGPNTEPITLDRLGSLMNAPGVWAACQTRNIAMGSLGAMALVVAISATTWGALARRE